MKVTRPHANGRHGLWYDEGGSSIVSSINPRLTEHCGMRQPTVSLPSAERGGAKRLGMYPGLVLHRPSLCKRQA